MSAWAVILIVSVVFLTDFVIIGAIAHGFAQSIAAPLAAAFPAREPLPGAVRREFQSFGIDLYSLGWCFHAAVDDECLHLQPARVARWFGMKPISIPWPAIVLKSPKARLGTLKATVTSGARSWTIGGPRWCLELAASPPA